MQWVVALSNVDHPTEAEVLCRAYCELLELGNEAYLFSVLQHLV